MKDIEDLVSGFRRFQQRYFGEQRELYQRLARGGQRPRLMVIGCCDSRVDPALITDCDPGDMFVVRNVANLVPPYETGGGYHGTSAALEFAVRGLRVEHVIVLGHARCGGIRALLGDSGVEGDAEFIKPWMSIAQSARAEVTAKFPNASLDVRASACEQAVVRVSLENLSTFPFVREAVAQGRLALHGWYFDIEHGELLRFDSKTARFHPLGATPVAVT
jgi:carbonic anhydrase